MKFAARMQQCKASEIRELLKLTEQPDMLSFAGGMPAPELFPTEALGRILCEVVAKEGRQILQYSATEGYAPLRAQLAERVNNRNGTTFQSKNILITNGSQQGLDMAGKLFLDKGSVILCESPTYLAAINAFRTFEPTFVAVETDAFGMLPEALERAISENDDIRMIYVIPDFQNPTGNTWSEERRRAFMEIVRRTNIPVVEDNPYGELRFEGIAPPSLLSLDTTHQVISLGTFSKILCPGFRVGWIAAAESLIRQFVLLKQSADLHTSTTTQAAVSYFLKEENIAAHIENLRAVYKRRKDLLYDGLASNMPRDVQISNPQGGLFLWLTLPEHMNARMLLERCLKAKVAFVPGGAFFPNGGHENTLRMNFSYLSEEDIVVGVDRFVQEYHNMCV